MILYIDTIGPNLRFHKNNQYCPSLPIQASPRRLREVVGLATATDGVRLDKPPAAVNEPIHCPSMLGTSYRFVDLRSRQSASVFTNHTYDPLYESGNPLLGE